MSSYTYKNMLIHERGSNNTYAKTLIKDKFNTWFPDPVSGFRTKSLYDKIIIILPDMTPIDRLVRLNNSDGFPDIGLPTGIIKLFCEANVITIYDIQFAASTYWNTYLPMFREYLVKTIQEVAPDLRYVDFVGYFIKWGSSLETNTIENCVCAAGLMSDRINKTHRFTSEQVTAMYPETVKSTPSFEPMPITNDPPSFKFGNSKTDKTFAFGTTQSKLPVVSFGFTPPALNLGEPVTSSKGFKFEPIKTPPVPPFSTETLEKTSFGFIPKSTPVYPTAFSFGEAPKPVASNTFSFGEAAKPVASNTFSFGEAAKPVASNTFSFGEAAKPVVSNTFSFGEAAKPVASNTFSFGEAAKPVASNTFSFGGVVSEQPGIFNFSGVDKTSAF
jgi:hypothetical protein